MAVLAVLAALVRRIAVHALADPRQGLAEPVGHVLDEPRLAAARGPLEEDGDALAVRRLEQLYLVRHGDVVGLLGEVVLLDYVAAE